MAEQEQLVNKKGKTNSAVWKYFGFKESDVEQKKVQCSRGGLAICVFWTITDGRLGPLFLNVIISVALTGDKGSQCTPCVHLLTSTRHMFKMSASQTMKVDMVQNARACKT